MRGWGATVPTAGCGADLLGPLLSGPDANQEPESMSISEGLAVSERPGAGDRDEIRLAEEPAVRLGALAIDPPLRTITHDDGRVEVLQPRVMQVLVALLRAEGRILSRDDLLASCWGGMVVGEDAIDRVIGRLRRLAEGIGRGAFELRTVTKVGYRLERTGETVERSPAAPDRAGNAICVLPFANMSDDVQQDYFSDGISEDIITDLSKVSSLFVVARTTSFNLRGANLDVPEIGRRLNVDYVLEGSVRKAAGQVRITAQLIDAHTGGHLWAERYDRRLDDIFAVQDEISEAVVRALKLKLAPREREAIEHRGTNHAGAYTLVLQARRYRLATRDGDLRCAEAIQRLCQKALEIDPEYAQAWALLGFAQMHLCWQHLRSNDGGRAAIAKALALDPQQAEALAVRARHLTVEGRHEEAVATIERAVAQDPDSLLVVSEAGRANYVAGRYAQAVSYYGRARDMAPNSAHDASFVLSTCKAMGDAEGVREAAKITLERAERAFALEYVNGGAVGCGVGACAALGDFERAREMMERALLIDPDNLNMRYNFACSASAFMADADLAIELLAPVFERASPDLIAHAWRDPDLAFIREDPRFITLLAARSDQAC